MLLFVCLFCLEGDCLFFNYFLFLLLLFSFSFGEDTTRVKEGLIWRDREMSEIGTHAVKLPKNQ